MMVVLGGSGPPSLATLEREATPMEGCCDRCGAWAEGKAQWMFHQGVPANEFHCERCWRIMRLYAAVGFTLLGLVLVGLAAAVWWLRPPN